MPKVTAIRGIGGKEEREDPKDAYGPGQVYRRLPRMLCLRLVRTDGFGANWIRD